MQVLYFTAKWCIPCRNFGPVMEQVENVEKIDVDDDLNSVTAFGILSVPTVVVLRDGAETGRFSGARDLDFVTDFIASH